MRLSRTLKDTMMSHFLLSVYYFQYFDRTYPRLKEDQTQLNKKQVCSTGFDGGDASFVIKLVIRKALSSFCGIFCVLCLSKDHGHIVTLRIFFVPKALLIVEPLLVTSQTPCKIKQYHQKCQNSFSLAYSSQILKIYNI